MTAAATTTIRIACVLADFRINVTTHGAELEEEARGFLQAEIAEALERYTCRPFRGVETLQTIQAHVASIVGRAVRLGLLELGAVEVEIAMPSVADRMIASMWSTYEAFEGRKVPR